MYKHLVNSSVSFFFSYNDLLILINSSLQDLQNGIKGLVVMSSDLEEIFTCIFEGRVPSSWLKGEFLFVRLFQT